MIIIRLEGGLGNQLFQYSYGLAMQAQHGGRLVLDRRLVRSDPSKSKALDMIVDLDTDKFADPLIAHTLRAGAGVAIRLMRSRQGSTEAASQRLASFGIHHPFTSRHIDLRASQMPFHYLHGNFMSEKYFKSALLGVRSAIHPERALGADTHELVAQIGAVNAVAVHVRRGDYLLDQWRDKLHVCTDDYYRRAVNIVLEQIENPVFHVFSNSLDDMHWVRENYQFLPKDTVFVPPGGSDIEHFALMASCRHFIIANSTYSWWASYLSSNPNKVIVAPSPWNRDAWDMTDLYLPTWKTVDLNLTPRPG